MREDLQIGVIEMSKVIEINGCITVQPEVSHDEFLEKFINFVEENGWCFGGGTKVFVDDEEVDE